MPKISQKLALFAASLTLVAALTLLINAQSASARYGVCYVSGIRTGQLALRFSPNGKSRAGLNNGNAVMPMRYSGIWTYVRVVSGPNRRVDGFEGWVNSSYLLLSVKDKLNSRKNHYQITSKFKIKPGRISSPDRLLGLFNISTG